MYTINKGPSKIVAKTRRGLAQNFEKFESIKESGRKNASFDLNSPEEHKNIPRPVFQQSFASKRITPTKLIEDEVITPQHEEIIRYINDSWNMLVAKNPYDSSSSAKPAEKPVADANNNSATSPVESIMANTPVPASSTATVWVEPPSPALQDFKPFDLESWWGRRLFQNITKSL
ncbi:MAPK regulated corepressor interacting protein 2 [Drosophila ficusphila]|uniref:MAPK regulated corepressor interacting protein 2 n=1 Tax=Drosophila ficusphila TaxID=30025 RepID=UPI0007E72E4F|nr:MAPK regulated corepressor interacting protein 2 [Drosophila ficusphila]